MDQAVALRAAGVFIALAILFGALGVSSHVIVIGVIALIGGSVAAMMLVLGAVPAARPVPMRTRPPGRDPRA